MAQTMSREEKSLQEIASEKSFLQTRWKALKDVKEPDEDEKNEKSYIQYRWKHIVGEEKALKSVLDSKSVKNAPTPAPESFAKKFSKSKKSLKQAHTFLKFLSELSTSEFKDGHRLQSYHYGRKMDEIIGKMFGGDEEDEDNEEKGKKNLAKLLLVTKDFPELKEQVSELNVTDPNGPSKYNTGDKLQQFGDGGSLAKKGKKDFSELEKADSEINVTKPKNDPKIAKLGEDSDVMPFYHGHDGEGSDHLISGVGKKQFDVLDEATSTVHTTKPGSPSHYAPGQEGMQQFGEGGTLVKFFKSVADAGAFLKTLAYEKAFGDSHRAMAKSLVKAMDDMDKPFAAEHSEFPGDLGNLLQEEGEPEHKALGGMGDPSTGSPSMGTPGEEDPLAEPLGMGQDEDMTELDTPLGMGKSGVKSLNTIRSNALQQSQAINELTKSLLSLQSMLN